MISTQNPNFLPDIQSLQNICKAISVLDAIISPEWEFRYYSYNSRWDIGEECFQMRNGSGDEMHILFHESGCAINGFAHEFEQKDKAKLTANIHVIFDEFIFGEPINSIGTTFCLWSMFINGTWQTGLLDNFDDNSEEMLSIFDGKPQTYCDWANEYFEIDIPLETVAKIYNGEKLTKDLVLSIVDRIENWKQLEKDINEIQYPYNFGSNWKFW